MKIRLTENAILEIIGEFQEVLNELTEDEFCRKPDTGSLSYAEIYCHVIHVNRRCLLAVERCIYGKQNLRQTSASLLTRAILYIGRLPERKINIPGHLASLACTITREEVKNDLINFTIKLKELMPKAVKCPLHQRVKHQRLGMLNCAEWLRFIEIYSAMHLRKLRKMIRHRSV